VKKNDRDGVLVYNSDYSVDLVRKITLKNDLKKTIEQEGLEVYYQPVYDLHTQKISGAEALVRWNHPKKGFIPPDQFVQIAENHGMILDLGEFVIKKVYEDLPIILGKFGIDFTLSINMSSKEFAHQTYVDKLIELTKNFQIDFRNIELEITETYIMQNHIEAVQKLQKLKDAGFALAIDDFGTGYSSLSYLKKFPIDKLKIDKAFVLNLLEDESDQAIVKTIIHIANIFNLKVQAEGVESLKHLDMLKEFHCDIAQGFYYSKPICLKDFLQFEGVKDV
jgi:EAL domain-containing protein (putative c-di-GMP-specific phosphodiesterase class I)